MNNINDNLDDKLDQLNKKIEKLVDLVDKRPNFYNNIFFEEESKSIPLNLINTNYVNINNKREKPKLNSLFKEDLFKNQNYLLEEPFNLLELPSSEESDNDEEHITFKSICDEIYDYDYLKIINDEDEDENEKKNLIKKKALPILMFKTFPELSSINLVLNYFYHKKFLVRPYEIRIVNIPEFKINKAFILKFDSFDNAKKAKESLIKDYDESFNINFYLCYDEREIRNNKKWYCVVFRRDCIYNKNNYKFEDMINEILGKIKCEKKIITIDNNEKKYKKMGNIYYTAIRVNSLNEAINLCIKYNKLSNLKVHLHYLTYENSKKELPKVLLEKNFIKEKLSLYEDEYMKNLDLLFPSLNKKRKKKKKLNKSNSN